MMPRHYAFAYLSAKGDKAKEREAVKGCPVEWQELVRKHIQNTRELTNGRHHKNSIKRK